MSTKVIIVSRSAQCQVNLEWDLTTQEVCDYSKLMKEIFAMSPAQVQEALEIWQQVQFNNIRRVK
ncbi:MAG: hypothetical protein ACKPEN_05140 [Planktothrix sp.]|uniref:hypothetical protein n=1 Tax=Planktothrix sp. TaxID=3088171 RepID=UPI0038D4EA05